MAPTYTYTAIITRVWDADSIHMTVILEDVKVDFGFFVYEERRKPYPIKTRLFGVDAPELTTEEGKTARDWLSERLPVGTEVTVQTFKFPGDKYGRWLAKIDAPGIGDVATALVEAGMAVAYDGGARV